MTVALRELGPEDATAYRELRLRGLREHPEAFGSSFEEESAMSLETVAERLDCARSPSQKVVLGAFIGSVLVGTIGCLREPRLKTRHRAMIVGMYVAPEARKSGVASALLDRATSIARTWDGVEWLTLCVVESAEPARRLYRSAGFEPFGHEIDALRTPAGRHTMIHMARRLQPD